MTPDYRALFDGVQHRNHTLSVNPPTPVKLMTRLSHRFSFNAFDAT